jgi:hypothetical protein
MHERDDLRAYLQISCQARPRTLLDVETLGAARVSRVAKRSENFARSRRFCAIVGQRGSRALRSGANHASDPGATKRV